MEVLQNSQKLRVDIRTLYSYPYLHAGIFLKAYRYPGYCASGVQSLLKFRVRVRMYRTYRSFGTGNTRKIPLGMVLYLPYRTQPWNFRIVKSFED